MRYVKIGNTRICEGRYTLTDVVNVDSGKVNKNTLTYIDTDGSEDRDIYFQPRIFEVHGMVLADSEFELHSLKQNLIKQCNPKKTYDVYYFNGFKEFYALARPDELPTFSKINYCNSEFILYLKIEGFFWLSNNLIRTDIFKRENLIKGSFTLPAVFTSRHSIATVINDGEETACPLFNIYCNADNDVIRIQNNTTSKFLSLKSEYITAKGETISIDCEKRTIQSSMNGNIIKYITKESEFISFPVGISEIECLSQNAFVTSTHRNKYLGV